MKLWHDDVRAAPRGWLWATNNDSAINALATGHVHECSLDHDLGGKPGDHYLTMGAAEETGYDLVLWMVERKLLPERINVHSLSTSGSHRMMRALQAAHRDSDKPFSITRVPYDPKTMV